jgi:hypothetical protein
MEFLEKMEANHETYNNLCKKLEPLNGLLILAASSPGEDFQETKGAFMELFSYACKGINSDLEKDGLKETIKILEDSNKSYKEYIETLDSKKAK